MHIFRFHSIDNFNNLIFAVIAIGHCNLFNLISTSTHNMQAKHHVPEKYYMKFQMPQYYAGTKNRTYRVPYRIPYCII